MKLAGHNFRVDVTDQDGHKRTVWEAQKMQTAFMLAPEMEVLYGGAAGGGKTDALVIDAMQLEQNGINIPKYRAAIFRKSLTLLKEVIMRGQEYYPQIVPGTVWRETDKCFVFPSGARIEMGFCKDENDHLNYASRQYQYLGWEELTEFPTDTAYRFLFSRVRAPKTMGDFQCKVRATTNPNGIGHSWVKERWKIPDEGTETSVDFIQEEPMFDEQGYVIKGSFRNVVGTRRFIPAKVYDNKYLGAEYHRNLSLLDDEDVKALRDGRWDIVTVAGIIFKDQIKRTRDQNRWNVDLPVSPDRPAFTFWDLGSNDTTAVWTMQKCGEWHHFVDYMEDSGKALVHYVNHLYDWASSHGIRFAAHYLPHDSVHKSLGVRENKSLKELLVDAGLKEHIYVVPRIQSIKDGIEISRRAFSSCKFAASCGDKPPTQETPNAGGLACLSNYRYKKNAYGAFEPKPVHNWASHGADAFRQFAQGYLRERASFEDEMKRRMENNRTYMRKHKSKYGYDVLYPDASKVF